MFLTFMCGCVRQLLLNQHDDDDAVFGLNAKLIFSLVVTFHMTHSVTCHTDKWTHPTLRPNRSLVLE